MEWNEAYGVKKILIPWSHMGYLSLGRRAFDAKKKGVLCADGVPNADGEPVVAAQKGKLQYWVKLAMK